MYAWIMIGVLRYRPTVRIAITTMVLAPITTILHSIGALWGILSTPDTFEVTDKIDESNRSEESNAEQN